MLEGRFHAITMLFYDESTLVTGAFGYPGTVAAYIENGSEYGPSPTSFLAATLKKYIVPEVALGYVALLVVIPDAS